MTSATSNAIILSSIFITLKSRKIFLCLMHCMHSIKFRQKSQDVSVKTALVLSKIQIVTPCLVAIGLHTFFNLDNSP